MVNFKKAIYVLILYLTVLAGGFWLAADAAAEPDKEYRSGQLLDIKGKNYLIVANKEFAEILEVTADNKIYQASEIHGVPKTEALAAWRKGDKYYLTVATGQYLYRYDISDPKSPKIDIKRDLYVFKRGQPKIGSVNLLAADGDYVFGAGSNGARGFLKDNLFVDKIYTFDKTYGLNAKAGKLAVITETRGLVFNIASGEKLSETVLENKEKMIRAPFLDETGNAYFPTDRGLIKVYLNGEKKYYDNPVPKTENFSYGASVLPDGSVYYVNGHGITVLDGDFNKVKFLNATSGGKYGSNPWAVGLASAKTGGREIIVDFNKSSILLFDKNLKLLAQYRYRKLYPDFVSFNLKAVASVNVASAGQKINLRLFGFWPNEIAAVTFGRNSYSVKVDNQGYAAIDLTVPSQSGRQAVIRAVGADSALSFETSFTIL